MKFGAWMVFAGLWATLVYFPIAHWVFAFSSADGSVTGGWIANGIKAIDFAGGTAVHMNAGAAALALALVLGRSSGWPKIEHTKPHSRPAGAGRRGPAVGRLVRLQRRLRADRRALGVRRFPQHCRGRGCRPPRLGTGGTDQARRATSMGAASGPDLGPRGHHSRLRRRQPARRAGHRRHRRRRLLAGHRTGSSASASTIRSTSSASTWWAASSERS